MYKFGIISTASITKRVIDAIRLTGNDVLAVASRSLKITGCTILKRVDEHIDVQLPIVIIF